MPEAGDFVTSLRAEEVALVAEIQAPVLVLNTRVQLMLRSRRRVWQLLIHALILRVHQVILFRVTVRGPFRRRDVYRPGGRGQAGPGGGRPGRGSA